MSIKFVCYKKNRAKVDDLGIEKFKDRISSI